MSIITTLLFIIGLFKYSTLYCLHFIIVINYYLNKLRVIDQIELETHLQRTLDLATTPFENNCNLKHMHVLQTRLIICKLRVN
jgi:hypothetical protein